MIIKESPLQGKKMGTADTVAMRELGGLHSIDLRVAPGAAAHTAVVKMLGIELPGKPGQIGFIEAAGESQSYVLCLAPDWWLLLEFPEAEEKLEPLANQFHFSSVDVSSQRTTIELQGPAAREVLAHLWEQDLREKSFPVGSVSQGLMAKAPVIVCRMAPFCFRVMVRSSFALHLWQALVDAAQEWV